MFQSPGLAGHDPAGHDAAPQGAPAGPGGNDPWVEYLNSNFLNQKKLFENPTAKSRVVREAAAISASYLHNILAAMGFDGQVSILGCYQYLSLYREGAVDANDMVEKSLLDAIAISRHALADSNAKATQAKSVEAARIYNSMAIRLTNELSNLTRTLGTHRESRRRISASRPQDGKTGEGVSDATKPEADRSGPTQPRAPRPAHSGGPAAAA
jgi:hypothetical protein